MIASQMVRTADDLSAFGGDALWVVLLKALFIFVVLILVGFFYVYKKGALDWSLAQTSKGAKK